VRYLVAHPGSDRGLGVFAFAWWFVLCFEKKKEEGRMTLGLGIFGIHLYLGFVLKIIYHLLFYMTNFIARIIKPVALHNAPRVRGARHRRSIRACPTTGGATLKGENRPAQPKCSLASA
jgi:hypothetical protein